MDLFFNIGEKKLERFGYRIPIPKGIFNENKRISVILPDPISVFPENPISKNIEKNLIYSNKNIDFSAIGVYHPYFKDGENILTDLIEEFKFRRDRHFTYTGDYIDTRNYYIAIPLVRV